jgi:rhamnogalacturonyl hydrolase YesR
MPVRSALARLAAVLALAATAPAARAGGPYRDSDNPNPADPWEGTYPIPYHRLSPAEIASDLGRVRAYLEEASPVRVVDRRTGRPIRDLSVPVAEAAADRGAGGEFDVADYPMGVIYAGMLLASETTGDRRYSDFTARRLRFIADTLPYFRAQAARFGPQGNSLRAILAPASLDDCGAMTAALIKARLAGVGPDLGGVIASWGEYIGHRQFRLPDGTLARRRPQPVSLWTDDFYMGIPALAQMGRLSGGRAWLDDAARNSVQLSARLFQQPPGLFAHGWNADNPGAPAFFWGRANGWAMMALCELLDVLPPDHPGRPAALEILRTHIRAVAGLQSGAGLWHQMLDRNDSYLETSASAMFVYGIAHAINRGWISPVTYGSIAQAGWLAVSAQINNRGQVENTCVATTFGSDQTYYYNRPVSLAAAHGYGPVLLAGAEMIRLLRNGAFEVRYSNRTYNYVPRTAPQSP